jgi:hypothetical protein
MENSIILCLDNGYVLQSFEFLFRVAFLIRVVVSSVFVT